MEFTRREHHNSTLRRQRTRPRKAGLAGLAAAVDAAGLYDRVLLPLDPSEADLLASVEDGEWQSIPNLSEYQETLRATAAATTREGKS